MASPREFVEFCCLFCVLVATVSTFPKREIVADSSSPSTQTDESQHPQKYRSPRGKSFYTDAQESNIFHHKLGGMPPIEEEPSYDPYDDDFHEGCLQDGDDDDDNSDEDSEGSEYRCENAVHSNVSPFRGSPCNHVNNTEMKEIWEHCKERDSNKSIAGCYCHGAAATCCGGDLERIPKFEKTILYVNFTENSLTALNEDTLENVTHVQWLILNKNHIATVSENAFQGMKALRCLEIAHNDQHELIHPKTLTAAVNKISTLVSLTLNATVFNTSMRHEHGLGYVLSHLALQNLTHLLLADGHISHLVLSHLHKVPNLKLLSVRNNTIQKVTACSEHSFANDADDVTRKGGSRDLMTTEGSCETFRMEKLSKLDLGYNWLVQFPIFCHVYENGTQGQSVLQSLTTLLLSVNALVHPKHDQMRCLPSLRILWMPGNPLRYIESKIFQGFPNLRELDLRYTNVLYIEAQAFNHSSIRRFTIKSSNWFFDTLNGAVYNMSADLFVGSQLSCVDLSYNVFRYVHSKRLERILKPLMNVSKLKMSEIGIDKIPRIVTEKFVHLRSLGVKSNVISDLPVNTFHNLTELDHVDLSDNHLTVIDVDLFRRPNSSPVLRVNLAKNPFSCSCDLLDFLHLFQSCQKEKQRIHDNGTTPKLLFTGTSYICHSPQKFALAKVSLNELVMTHQMCLLSLEQEILICTLCLLFIGGIVFYAILYRFRWQVRFWLYEMHVRLSPRKEVPARGRARFRAFVSYCQKDSNFVLSEVLPALEKGHRMPLCIHERDFIAGRYLDENIIHRMAESSHVLLVLSNAFLQDDWCRFELFVAQRYGMVQRRIPISIVMLENLDVQLLEPSVMLLLHSFPGLEWPGQDSSVSMKENFWRCLGQSLRR